jgi:hypothetical protein
VYNIYKNTITCYERIDPLPPRKLSYEYSTFVFKESWVQILVRRLAVQISNFSIISQPLPVNIATCVRILSFATFKHQRLLSVRHMRFYINKFYIVPIGCIYVLFVCISEGKKQRLFAHSLTGFHERVSVHCTVRTEYLNKRDYISSFSYNHFVLRLYVMWLSWLT